MRRRFPFKAMIKIGVFLLGTGLALSGCGGQPAADTETSTSALAAAIDMTTAPPDEAPSDYVRVLNPYHNEFLDAPTYLIPKTITLAHPLPEFPESVPAQKITSETLPETDLSLEPHPSVAGRYSWLSSVGDMAQTDVTLGSQDVAAGVARAFLEAHGLWNADYSAPQVSVGSSESGAKVKITSWVVRFDREPAAAGLERFARVRVGDRNEVIQVSLAIPQVDPLGDRLVRLRPIAEVVADLKAWQMGDSGALQNEIQGEVAVEIRSVFLAYEDPGSGHEPIAVPVYRFEVEVRGPEGAAPTTGFWTVVAAADVVGSPQESGTIMSPDNRTSLANDAEQLRPVVADGKLGFMNSQGEVVIRPQFVDWPYSRFSEGLAPVSLGGKFGYIDRTGRMVIQPQFAIADPFSEGLAAVVGDNNLWGFIDKTGAVVVPMRYGQHPGPFSDGLCAVMIDERPTGGKLQNEYIDKTGAVVIGPFEWSTNFSEGLAAVGLPRNGVVKWGYMDTSGGWVIEPRFNYIRDFSDGLAAVGFPHDNDSAIWGYIDRTGVVVIEPQFDGADPFSEGMAAVAVLQDDGVRYGYIDKTGTVVIKPQFEWASEFSEGLAAVGTTSGLCGYVDKTGAFVIPMELEGQAFYPFSGGLARFDAKALDGSISPVYIDKTGKVIWQAR